MDIRVYTDKGSGTSSTIECDYYFAGIIDVYTSLIWNDKYCECGDFQLEATDGCGELIKKLKLGDILMIYESPRAMIVEKYLTEVTVEDGAKYTITGRSVEILLNRRIVWGNMEFQDTMDKVVETLINDNFITPANEKRRFPMAYVPTDEKFITDVEIDNQWEGTEIYDVIQSLCDEHRIGFKLIFDPDLMKFTFSLYSGKDRSYNQFFNPFVIFSHEFENLKEWNHYRENTKDKNSCYVVGVEQKNVKEEDTTVRLELPELSYEQMSGFYRKEVYVDASDVSTTTTYVKGHHTYEKKLSDEEYYALLKAEGESDFAEYIPTEVIDGDADIDSIFVYGEDYELGDIVQMEDTERNFKAAMRITGMVFGFDKNGFKSYPTFEELTWDEKVRLYGRTFGKSNVTIYGLEKDIPLLPTNNSILIDGSIAYCVDTSQVYAFSDKLKQWVHIE